jgi:alpha-ketoglutarate-dependent taurine dioxygenase
MKFIKKTKFKDVKNPNKLKKLLKKYKVVLVQGCEQNNDLISFIDDYLQKIGEVLNGQDEDLITGKQTGKKFIDITYNPLHQNLYRSSSNSQPLHTDFSYVNVEDNIQFLLCVSASTLGGATTFIDTKYLIELMIIDGKENLLNNLKTVDVGFKKCDVRFKKTKIIKEVNGDFKINYNYQPFLRYNNDQDVVNIVNEFKEFLEVRVEKSGLLTNIKLNKGDIVFFNDSLVLHGRNSYFAKNEGDRKLIKGTLIV